MVEKERADGRLRGVWIVLLLMMVASPLYAYDRQRRERPRRDRVREIEPRLSEEGQAGFREVEAALKELLSAVNKNQQPDQALLDNAADLLLKNKRYSQDYEDSQKAVYMLLQAWVGYYDKDMKIAMNWALRAAKTDQTHRDAWISSAVFCLLNDKRPKLPRVQKTLPARTSRSRRNSDRMRDMDRPEQNTELKNGVLAFELTALRQEMFSERYEQIDYRTQWPDQIDYDSAKDTLCVLFWQSDAEANEVADPNEMTPDQRRAEKMRERQAPQTPQHEMRMPKLERNAQQKYFKQMAEACRDEKNLKFFEVNTDVPKVAEKVRQHRMETPGEKDVPLLFADQTALEPADYAQISRSGPVMLVTAPGGKIKYAGPAADFIPAFILTATTGVEIDLQAVSRPASPGMQDMPGMDMMDPYMQMEMEMGGPSVRPRSKTADPNVPAGIDPNTLPVGADPNMPAVAQPTPEKKAPTPKPAVKKELSLEDQMNADRLLSLAYEQIEASRKIRGKSPKLGVDACKEVMEKYPGTEYDDKARKQLERVPQRLWKKFKIAELLDL